MDTSGLASPRNRRKKRFTDKPLYPECGSGRKAPLFPQRVRPFLWDNPIAALTLQKYRKPLSMRPNRFRKQPHFPNNRAPSLYPLARTRPPNFQYSLESAPNKDSSVSAVWASQPRTVHTNLILERRRATFLINRQFRHSSIGRTTWARLRQVYPAAVHLAERGQPAGFRHHHLVAGRYDNTAMFDALWCYGDLSALPFTGSSTSTVLEETG